MLDYYHEGYRAHKAHDAFPDLHKLDSAIPQCELGGSLVPWHLVVMSTITIPLPDEDLTFLRAYSEAQGLSAEAFLAGQARNLRERLQRPLQADVLAASGILLPDIAGQDAHREHLEKKHA